MNLTLKDLLMIKVLTTGLYTSVQDLGRFGLRNYGVPNSGAMDEVSFRFANALLNNHKNDAALEIILIGPRLLFLKETLIVIAGADMSAKINNTSIKTYKVYSIKKGDIVSFGNLKYGTRSYLAVKGGIQSEIILKSRSFFNEISDKNIIYKNDVLDFKEVKNPFLGLKSTFKKNDKIFVSRTLEVYRGPDLELFSSEEIIKITSTNFTVSNNNNRMGYQLNETVLRHKKSIITSPVLPGTVQLLPSGKLIILMKDAQTTGGYPRIFQLTEESISILAQKKRNDQVVLKLLD